MCRTRAEFVWKYADFVLDRDEEKGVEIFKELFSGSENEERKIVSFLDKYPKARIEYLEFLIHERESKIEHFHTVLALNYLTLIETGGGSAGFRQRFQSLLVKSDLIRWDALLSRLEKTDLEEEKAILHGKLGDHRKALEILALKVGDASAAENYCDKMSGNCGKKKRKLLLNLLEIYLADENFSHKAKDLLERRSREFEAMDVIRMLPGKWSVASIAGPLQRMILESSKNVRFFTSFITVDSA